MYREFKIKKKKNKYREIQAPNDELKKEQKRILYSEINDIKVSKNAFGFVSKRNIYDNAKIHLGAKWILELDLKEFFDTVTREQVYNALMNNGLSEEKAEYISYVSTRKGFTPQGAPTSPHITNIVCKPMDKKIDKLCEEFDCTYTRYADDITISSKSENGFEVLQNIKPKLQSIIMKNGFKINGSKTHTLGKHRQQNVTGIVINETTTIPRKKVMQYRGILHNLEREVMAGKYKSLMEIDNFQSIQGYLAYLYKSNETKYQKYWDQLERIKLALKNG